MMTSEETIAMNRLTDRINDRVTAVRETLALTPALTPDRLDAIRIRDGAAMLGQATPQEADQAILDRGVLLGEVHRLRRELDRYRRAAG